MYQPCKNIFFVCFIFFLTATLLIPLKTWAEEKEGPGLHVAGKYTGKKILLRWAPSDLSMDYHYTVTRKEKESIKAIGSFRKIPLAKINENYQGDDAKLIQTLLYPQSLYKTDKEKLEALSQQKNQVAMAYYLAELQPKIAEAMGLRAADATCEPGKVYTYTITAMSENTEIARASVIVSTNEAKKLHAPSLKVRRYPWGCSLKWTAFDVYSAFQVYRSESEEGPYTRINSDPVSVNHVRLDNGTVQVPPWFYSDTAIDLKKPSYYYKVSGIDSFGDESELSDPVFAIRDGSIRPMPQNPVTVEISEPHIRISWQQDKSKLVIAYNLFRAYRYNGEYKKLNKKPLSDTAYLDKKVDYNTNYFYCHTAVARDGRESVMSLPRLIVLKDRTPPAVPQHLSAIARAGSVELSWHPVFDGDLKGYEIYRALEADAPDWAKLNGAPLKAGIFIDTMAETLDKKPYYYKVLALDKEYNRSEFSNLIKIKLPDITPPRPPVPGPWKNENNAIVLSWKKQDDPDFASFNLYQGLGNKKTKLVNLKENSYSFTPEQSLKQIYHFSVTSLDKDGNESEPALIRAAFIDKTAPVISAFELARNAEGISLTIQSDDRDIKTLVILRKSRKNAGFKKIYAHDFITAFRDIRVDKDKAYTYKVLLYDKNGNSTGSDEKTCSAKQ